MTVRIPHLGLLDCYDASTLKIQNAKRPPPWSTEHQTGKSGNIETLVVDILFSSAVVRRAAARTVEWLATSQRCSWAPSRCPLDDCRWTIGFLHIYTGIYDGDVLIGPFVFGLHLAWLAQLVPVRCGSCADSGTRTVSNTAPDSIHSVWQEDSKIVRKQRTDMRGSYEILQRLRSRARHALSPTSAAGDRIQRHRTTDLASHRATVPRTQQCQTVNTYILRETRALLAASTSFCV